MPTITLFQDDWYHDIIRQTVEGFADNTSPDAAAVATGIMTAGACIAQAIDHAFAKHRSDETVQSALQDLAYAVERIGETLSEANEAFQERTQ